MFFNVNNWVGMEELNMLFCICLQVRVLSVVLLRMHASRRGNLHTHKSEQSRLFGKIIGSSYDALGCAPLFTDGKTETEANAVVTHGSSTAAGAHSQACQLCDPAVAIEQRVHRTAQLVETQVTRNRATRVAEVWVRTWDQCSKHAKEVCS